MCGSPHLKHSVFPSSRYGPFVTLLGRHWQSSISYNIASLDPPLNAQYMRIPQYRVNPF